MMNRPPTPKGESLLSYLKMTIVHFIPNDSPLGVGGLAN